MVSQSHVSYVEHLWLGCQREILKRKTDQREIAREFNAQFRAQFHSQFHVGYKTHYFDHCQNIRVYTLPVGSVTAEVK